MNNKNITPENDLWLHEDHEQKKYNLMFIATPDTEARVKKIQTLLTENLSEEVDMQVVKFDKFWNTAWNPVLLESIRGKHVYVYADVESNYKAQELLADTNSRYMLVQWILNAAKIYGAKTLNVIFPMFPYSRSDKEEKIGTAPTNKRKPLYVQIVASHMKALWVDYIFTIDIHNVATKSMFGTDATDPKVINIPHSWVIQQWIAKHNVKPGFELWSTDGGWTDKIQEFLKDMQVNWYVAFKARDFSKPNTIARLFIEKWFAEITDKDVVLYDDMIDTASTIEAAIDQLHEHKPRSIIIISTHGLFNDKALERLQRLYDTGKIEKVYITNSVYRSNLPDFIEIIDTSKIFARQIARKSMWQSLDPNWTGWENGYHK